MWLCGMNYLSSDYSSGEDKMDQKNKSAKTVTTKTWYLGRVYRMGRKIGNMWSEYRQLIDI